MFRSPMIFAILCRSLVSAQTAGVDIRVDDAVIPPGQVVQIKTMLTEPKPISGGKGVMKINPALTTLRGIAAFNPAGDLSGVATFTNATLMVRCLSPSNSWGTDDDYPLYVVAAEVSPNTQIGSTISLSLIASSSWWLDPQGSTYPEEVHTGVLTVGGTLSINEVEPGGGTLPAGSIVKVLGSGFDASTKLQVNEVKLSNVRVITSNEIDFTLSQTANLTGTRVRVSKSGGEKVEYYSYLRAIHDSPSSVPAVAAVIPIFPTKPYSSATFNLAASSQYFNALSLQNPAPASVSATVSLYSAANALLSTATVALSPRHSVVREASELLGNLNGATYVRITTPTPIQMMAFKVDRSTSSPSPSPGINAH